MESSPSKTAQVVWHIKTAEDFVISGAGSPREGIPRLRVASAESFLGGPHHLVAAEEQHVPYRHCPAELWKWVTPSMPVPCALHGFNEGFGRESSINKKNPWLLPMKQLATSNLAGALFWIITMNRPPASTSPCCQL